MTKPETLQFFDKIISDYHVNIEFNAEVYGMRGLEGEEGARFRVESSQGRCVLTGDTTRASSRYQSDEALFVMLGTQKVFGLEIPCTVDVCGSV